MKTKYFLLTVAFATMAFTISCSSDDGDGGSSSSENAQGRVSSSSGGGTQGGYSSSSSSIPCSDAGNGTFTDDRDGKTYKYVTICSQTWMAENLIYEAEGSKCYHDSESYCTTWGRLYDWATAMSACPSGWHLPSDAEWTVLTDYVDDGNGAGTKLKATSGWGYAEGPGGTDEFGFSALPGGYANSIGLSLEYYNDGYWWSATENYRDAYYRNMVIDGKPVSRGSINKTYYFSVRCLQD